MKELWLSYTQQKISLSNSPLVMLKDVCLGATVKKRQLQRPFFFSTLKHRLHPNLKWEQMCCLSASEYRIYAHSFCLTY